MICIPNNLQLRETAERQASQFFKQKGNILHKFDSIEDLIIRGEDCLEQNDYEGLLYHLTQLLNDLIHILWRRQIFLGRSLIAELIFRAAKDSPNDLSGYIKTILEQSPVGNEGIIVYPLQGFGIEWPILTSFVGVTPTHSIFYDMNFALCTQQHSIKNAYHKLSGLSSSLGVEGKLDFPSIDHHFKAGNLNWLTRNPLLIVKIASHTGEYYENQTIYTLKIKIISAYIFMLYALNANTRSLQKNLNSSAFINNWQTLDFHHYLIGEARQKKKEYLEILRVPMNMEALTLARLSDLSITLTTSMLQTQYTRYSRYKLSKCLKRVEEGYLAHVLFKNRLDAKKRVFRRLSTCLEWYRKSFSRSSARDDAVVSLAVAFEILLTDHYKKGINETIIRRVRMCLNGRKKIEEYTQAVRSVVESRGAILHYGNVKMEADLVTAQAVFVMIFEKIANRTCRLKANWERPIETLVGDYYK